MVDQEVAEILAELKRRVISREVEATSEASDTQDTAARAISTATPASRNGYASLPVMARAWDRLPPVVSNRSGNVARLELWLKEKLKRAFRWFAWEQINFNAAVYQTFLELVESLDASQRQLGQQIEDLKRQQRLVQSFGNQLEQFERHIAQVNARLEGLSQTANDYQARLAEVVTELRAQTEQLLDEQRVCYRQLSLELTESRVLEDRARRELDARVTRLESQK